MHSHNQLYTYTRRNIVDTIMTNEIQFFRKIYLSHFIRNATKGLRKGYCVRGELETEQKLQHIDPPALLAIAAHLSCSDGLLNRGPWDLVLTLRTATTDSKLWSPTNSLPVPPGLYLSLTSTCFLWRQNSHSIQPVDSQGYPLISSTGCTCYLHRCISYLTARPGRRSICYTCNHTHASPLVYGH